MLLLQREHPLCPRVQSTNTCLYTRLYSSSPGHSTLPANRPCGPTVWGRGINSARHPIFAESLRNCACARALAAGRPADRNSAVSLWVRFLMTHASEVEGKSSHGAESQSNRRPKRISRALVRYVGIRIYKKIHVWCLDLIGPFLLRLVIE